MDKFVIEGGGRLTGDICVSGAKNSVVALLPATLLLDVPCVIENVPDISDVEICLNILRALGAEVEKLSEGTYRISTIKVTKTEVPPEYARKMRASYYFLGALLGRSRMASAAMPGGCNLGERPIDQHLLAFETLGAETALLKKRDAEGEEYVDAVRLRADKLIGTNISLNVVSVGATMNAILAAVKAEGITVIENCAREPHIVDLANFLNYMGANIIGAGTHKIMIEGTPVLCGNDALAGSVEERTYSVVPDQIEAGTFMVAAAATRGDVLIHGVIPRHVRDIAERLIECGVSVEVVEDESQDDSCIRVHVDENKRLRATNIKTEPYPGFPTDMQPQMGAFLSIVDGQSNIIEQVWDDRFRYVEELRLMGAHINTTMDGAIIFGVPGLHGANVKACDLRAGAAMIIAALTAEGTTEITDIHHIERGYSHIVDKLRGIGANIRRVSE